VPGVFEHVAPAAIERVGDLVAEAAPHLAERRHGRPIVRKHASFESLFQLAGR
jgi:hypothetical protein